MNDDVTPDDVRAQVAASPYASLLHDERALSATLAGLMARSDHPVLAEMGRALVDGELGWRELAGRGPYREVLDSGLTALREIDLATVSAELAAEEKAAEEKATEEKAGAARVRPGRGGAG